MVAACIRADTGVGPAIASGNQVCKKNCPDFDITAAIRQQAAINNVVCESRPDEAKALVVAIEKEPKESGIIFPEAKKRIVTPINFIFPETFFVAFNASRPELMCIVK